MIWRINRKLFISFTMMNCKNCLNGNAYKMNFITIFFFFNSIIKIIIFLIKCLDSSTGKKIVLETGKKIKIKPTFRQYLNFFSIKSCIENHSIIFSWKSNIEVGTQYFTLLAFPPFAGNSCVPKQMYLLHFPFTHIRTR